MTHRYPPPPPLAELGLVAPAAGAGGRWSGDDLPKLKKFRFQLLAGWIAERFPPCTVADVGGGKGLLTLLLRDAGFQARWSTRSTSRCRPGTGTVRPAGGCGWAATSGCPAAGCGSGRGSAGATTCWSPCYAHGSNLAVLETVARAGNSCVVLPCCVVDEPSAPGPGQNWFMWLVDHARELGLQPEFFSLNFRGQHIGFVIRGTARPAAHSGACLAAGRQGLRSEIPLNSPPLR